MTDPVLPHTDPHPHGDGPVVPETKAKQGRGGMHVMVIMVVSALLVAVLFAVIWLVWSPRLDAAEERGEAAATSPAAIQPTPERPTPTLPDAAQPAAAAGAPSV